MPGALFVCVVCDYSTTNKGALGAHKKHKHNLGPSAKEIEDRKRRKREYAKKYAKEYDKNLSPEKRKLKYQKKREAHKDYYKQYRETHKQEHKEYIKKWIKKNWWYRRYPTLKRLGMTCEQFKDMLRDQKNKCALCWRVLNLKDTRSFSIDHCHSTGKIRGVIHSRCNHVLGHSKEDIGVLQAAIKYLKKHRRR